MGLELALGCEWVRPAGSAFAVGQFVGEAVLAARPGVRWQRYDAFLEAPLLFREFISLDGSPESFCAFADAYGLLEARPDAGQFVERLSLWAELHASLKEHATRYDRAAEPGQVEPVTTATGPLFTGAYEAVIAAIVGAARSMREGLTPSLAMEPVAMIFDGRARLGLDVTAKNLRSALLLQLLLCLIEGGLHERCEGCGRWFDRADGEGRIDRKACSPACRARVYRKRKKGAA